jgi:RNA polymerase-binding transcription factor DksA
MVSTQDLRQQLEDRLDELDRRRRRVLEDESELTKPNLSGPVTEPANEEVLEDLERSSLKEVRMIMAALERLRQGEYGICARCGSPIAEERLAALPATPFCADCASEVSPAP